MKTITEQLFELGKGIIEQHIEVSDHTGKFSMADDGGVETETGELLYALTRIIKPELVLETGTYTGISAMYMAAGLQHNNIGHLFTLETSAIHKERAERLWQQVGISPQVTCQQIASLDYQTDKQYDLIFLDSEPEFRFKELVKFYPNLKPGGFLLIHDLHHHLSQHDNKDLGFGWPFGELPMQIKNWLREDKLRFVPFPTPRGLAMFYKTKPEDYTP